LGFRHRVGYPIEDGRGNTLFVLEKAAAEVAGTRVGLADNHRDKDT
jgi:hypothetical protein